jgi:hypothetical protein
MTTKHAHDNDKGAPAGTASTAATDAQAAAQVVDQLAGAAETPLPTGTPLPYHPASAAPRPGQTPMQTGGTDEAEHERKAATDPDAGKDDPAGTASRR